MMKNQSNNSPAPRKATMMMSRRGLLQTLGAAAFGLGATSLADAASPKAAAKHYQPITNLKGTAGDVVWDDELQQPFSSQVSGIYGDGYAVLYDSGGEDKIVLAYDVHAGLASYSNSYWYTRPLGDLHIANGIMVAPSTDQNGNSGFAAFPAKALSLTPAANFCPTPTILSNAVDMSNGVAYIAGDGNLYYYSFYVDETQTIQSHQNWSFPLNSGSRDTAILDYGGGQTMVACLGTTAVLCDLSNSSQPKTMQTVTLPGAPVQIASSGSAWYVFLNSPQGGYRLYSFPWTVKFLLNIPEPSWGYSTAAMPGKPVVYNACIYFADAGGKFSAIDLSTGAYSWGTQLGGDCSQAEISIEDGIAYLCNTAGTLYAIDLSATENPQVVQKTMGNAGALLGVENGVCVITYVDPGNNAQHLAAIDMAGQVHGFSCESTLLPDEMTGEPGSNQPSTPVYHTYVQLLDPNKNPRAFCSVKISVYEDVTLSDGTSATITFPNGPTVTGAATYSVTATKPVWLTTDASGALNLTIQADDLSCPSLYLWSTFMDRDESIVIYPDHTGTQKMQTASPSDLAAAQSFDGTKLLPVKTDTTALSTALGQTLSGGVSASMSLARAQQKVRGARYATAKRQDRNARGRQRVFAAAGNPASYITFPGSTTNMQYQYPANAQATRPYAPSASSSFAFDIADDGSMTPATVTLRAANSPPLLGLSFSDFKSKIVHGLNKIKHIETNIDNDLKQAIHNITSDVGELYTLTVTSIEDALTVVAGLLKTLASDINKAIQWVAQLFDWTAILANKDLLKGQVCAAFADFTTRINALTATGCKDVHDFFAAIKADFQKAVGGANSTYGDSTIQSKQSNNNDPKAVFSNGSLGPANHFHSKLKNNVGQTQMNATQVAQVLRVGGVQAAGCSSVTLDSLKTIVEAALSSCGTALKDDLEDIKNSLEAFFKSFQLLLTDPSAFVKNSLTDLLNLFVAIVDTIIDAADLVIEALLGVVAALIEGVMYLATATIHIPLISPLWNAITGDPLSFLDVACLAAAIPYTIIEKAASLTKLGAINGQAKAWAIFTFLSAAIDGVCDSLPANDPNSPLSILDLVLDTITFGLSYPAGSGLTALGGAYWACQITPVVINFTNCILFATDSEAAEAFNLAAPNFLSAFGCVNGPGAVYMAFQEPNVYMGTDGLSLVGNILGNIVLVSKPGVNAGPISREVVAGMDFILPVTGAILGLANDSI